MSELTRFSEHVHVPLDSSQVPGSTLGGGERGYAEAARRYPGAALSPDFVKVVPRWAKVRAVPC